MVPGLRDNCVTLNNGDKMPLVGLGCWQSSPGQVEKAVEEALDCGYRHLDTAYAYRNEKEVGIGIQNWIKKSHGKREDIFVVTKLPTIGMREDDVEKFLRLSLKALNLSYVDLYLLHLPIGLKGKDENDIEALDENGKFRLDFGTDHIAIWKKMEKMVSLGLTKSIGVSNFSIRQMRKLQAIAKIPPAVNQVEMNVFYQQRDLVDYCKENNIILTAYAPFGSPGRVDSEIMKAVGMANVPNLLSNPVIQLIAAKHQVTTAQILIKFLIQQGITTIPKSVTPARIRTNGDVLRFTLDETDNEALRSLDKGKEGCTFPFANLEGFKDHPEIY